MHIEFKKVTLHNFMSFSHSELCFNDDGFIRVSGVNENPLDNAGSNGSGKSSLWEAVVWVLTGETIRGTKHIVNIYGDDGCFVDIEFYIDNTKYQLIRAKDHKIKKTSLQILINDQDVSGKGVRDSEKLLQQYLPDITASLLGSVIILGQGLPQKFTNNTPSGRKEVLEKLSNSDFMIEDLKKRVNERKQVLQGEQRSIEDTLLQDKTRIALLEKQVAEQQQILSTLDKTELEDQLNELKVKQRQLEDELNIIESNISRLSEEQSKYNLELTQLTVEKTNTLQQAFEEHQVGIAEVKDKVNALTIEINSLNKQLKTMLSIQDVCPTCGQKLPDVHKPDTTSITVELEKLNNSLTHEKSCLLEKETNYSNMVTEINQQFTGVISNINTTLQRVSAELTSTQSSKLNVTTSLTMIKQNIMSVQVQLAQLDATINSCNKIIRENNEESSILNNKIMYNNEQRDLTQSHLDVVTKFDTIIKRDFRGYLLSTVIEYIQERTKYYSRIIFDTTDVTFALEGNNIDIHYSDRSYENLSGGEKQKIDLIIQFSIRDMLSKHLGFTSNILVLDEVFDGLDALGCSKVIDMISNLSDIKNIFIVTHRKDLSIPTDKDVIVVKSSAGISEIRV